MNNKYITTSIAYVNAEPHIGYLFELLSADVLARSWRLTNQPTFFLTGTDEHGQKIAAAAEAARLSPQAWVDQTSAKFKQLLADFSVSADFFIRTTDRAHQDFVQQQWQVLVEKKLLSKKTYHGYYCGGCESFKTSREMVAGKCSIHQTELDKVAEENWFFDLSSFTVRIESWQKAAIWPTSRISEAVQALEEIKEVSVSRPRAKLSWGIPVPGDGDQVMYVWVDALLNYLSALETAGKKDFWPASSQVIGKDILRFHAVVWPALLLALDYPLPERLAVHGFINVDGTKMSKSLGNVISPAQLLERYHLPDAVRYLILRQFSFKDDGNFVWADIDRLYQGELANGLGNLVSRVIGLLKRSGLRPELAGRSESSELILSGRPDFNSALEAINAKIKDCDSQISQAKLWENLDSDQEKRATLGKIATDIFALTYQLEPFMPNVAGQIRLQLSKQESQPLFPRLEA